MKKETGKELPRLKTIRQIAKSGIMPENALRQAIKKGTIPVFYAGSRAYVNEVVLLEILNKRT